MQSSAGRWQRRSNHVFAPQRSSCLVCLSRVEKCKSCLLQIDIRTGPLIMLRNPLSPLAIACQPARRPSPVNRAGEIRKIGASLRRKVNHKLRRVGQGNWCLLTSYGSFKSFQSCYAKRVRKRCGWVLVVGVRLMAHPFYVAF